MTHTRIKICGITRPEDARVAVTCGADAIGLVFYNKSPRAVTVEQAVKIAAVIPPFITIVALFVNESAETIRSTIDSVPVDHIQFHGDETAEFCQQFKHSYIKALRVRPGLDLPRSCAKYGTARGVLLDAWREGVPGGTGESFDWKLARVQLPLPLILAGGLGAGNVGDAIRALHPAAVDVSGGVEMAPGIKDASKIKQFISAVKLADQQ